MTRVSDDTVMVSERDLLGRSCWCERISSGFASGLGDAGRNES